MEVHLPGWSGSGTFTRVHDWSDDRDGGTKILATRFDAENDGFAAGIQACLAKNGENAATANLNLGGFRFTNGGATSARSDLALLSEIQDGDYNYAAAGGTADVITVSLSPAITAYSEGVIYCFQPSANNATTTPTININSVGAKTIVKRGSAALVADDIVADEPALVVYNSTDDNFTLINPATAVTASSTDTLTNKTIDADNNTISNIALGAEATGASTDLTDTADLTYNADTDVSSNGWVVDEDNMASDLATKVPTQQSVKAYVDAASDLTVGTEQATTTGTTKGFTSIPAGTKMIELFFAGLSSSGTDHFLVQIGDSGGYETTGYVSGGNIATTYVTSTAGYILLNAGAASVLDGSMKLIHSGSNKWMASHVGAANGGSESGGGVKTLTAELDRIQITTTGGSDTFDAGLINIVYHS